MDATEIESTPDAVAMSELSLDVDSVAIARLVEEVRSGDAIAPTADYNRTYNRHNR